MSSRKIIQLVSAVILTLGWVAAQAAAAEPAAPEPLMRLSTLNPKAGEAVWIRLNLPTGEGWREANIGLLIVRAGGEQRSIPVEPKPGEDFITVTFDQPGYALIVLSAGPASATGHSDSWQRTPYCSKAVLRVSPKDGKSSSRLADSGSGVVGKVGQKLEILPLINPSTLRVGDDLPVRVYYEGVKQRGVTVQAISTDHGVGTRPAKITDKTSDSVGTAWFSISDRGRWMVRFEHTVDDVRYVAELVFDVHRPAKGSEVEQKDAGGGE
ncbi:MAG: DUF4198 domain-containing protein [Planctomycetes bacterium]|nr:DUF4198 domain-containing protein [Planctomycetota bacterium]